MRQILIAAAVGLSVTLLGTPIAIRLFRLWGWGQRIREDGPHTHLEKMGTPTMGGTVIIAGIVAGYVATRIVFTTVTAAGISVLLATVLLGAARVHRRLHQGAPAAVARPVEDREDRGPGRGRPDLRDGGRPGGGGADRADVHPRHRRRARAPVLPVGVRDPRGVLERREPDRRARRPRLRRVDPRALRLRLHRVLAVPAHVRADRRAPPATRSTSTPRSTSRSSRGPGSGRPPGSCGGTPRRPGSSWAIRARSPSAG